MAEYTLSYNTENIGWPSFYSYKPDFIGIIQMIQEIGIMDLIMPAP